MMIKIFFINLIWMIALAVLDEYMLDRKILNSKYLGYLVSLWVGLTVLSVPVMVSYLILQG